MSKKQAVWKISFLLCSAAVSFPLSFFLFFFVGTPPRRLTHFQQSFSIFVIRDSIVILSFFVNYWPCSSEGSLPKRIGADRIRFGWRPTRLVKSKGESILWLSFSFSRLGILRVSALLQRLRFGRIPHGFLVVSPEVQTEVRDAPYSE